jgi:hypothetical protein
MPPPPPRLDLTLTAARAFENVYTRTSLARVTPHTASGHKLRARERRACVHVFNARVRGDQHHVFIHGVALGVVSGVREERAHCPRGCARRPLPERDAGECDDVGEGIDRGNARAWV